MTSSTSKILLITPNRLFCMSDSKITDKKLSLELNVNMPGLGIQVQLKSILPRIIELSEYDADLENKAEA
jgi:hypothetical protein